MINYSLTRTIDIICTRGILKYVIPAGTDFGFPVERIELFVPENLMPRILKGENLSVALATRCSARQEKCVCQTRTDFVRCLELK